MDEWQSLAVPASGASRVDRLISDNLVEVGRKLSARLCADGDVLIDGRRAKKSDPVAPDSTVLVRVSAWGVAQPAPEIELEVLVERPDFVVINKPAGIPTGAVVGKETGTAAGALLARYPEMAGVGFSPREPGVVHRLDNQTSGALLAARTQGSFQALRSALTGGAFEKRYLALVDAGTLTDSGTITEPLENDPSARHRVRVAEPSQGRSAETRFVVLRRGREIDLVEASANSAFRHQVRAHLAAAGAPLWGDVIYGGRAEPLAPRHALHASYIACSDPKVGSFAAEASLPADLSALAPPAR